VRAFRTRGGAVDPMLRENVMSDARFKQLEHTFGALPNAMRYFSKLPRTPLGAARHLLRVREFPAHLVA
jgi:hypothetical protein